MTPLHTYKVQAINTGNFSKRFNMDKIYECTYVNTRDRVIQFENLVDKHNF